MPDDIYEVVAQGARYWFLFLMALIVWRSWRWLARDRKQSRKRLKLLPDAGFVGEMVVQTGNAQMPAGLTMPVPREGVLGRVRGADVCVPAGGVAKRHLWFEYDEENGLYIEPYSHHSADADGQPLLGRRTHAYLTHGSRLTVGDAVLRLRMFAGFEQAGVKGANTVAFADEQAAPGAGAPQAAISPQAWAAWQAAQGMTPQQIAAMQAQAWAAWQAAQGYTPQQLAAMQAGQMPPAQLAAMQAQAWAAWQAAQGYTPQQLATMQAGPIPATPPMPAIPGAQPAPDVLTTAAGAFAAPQRIAVSARPAPILRAEDSDGETDAPGEPPVTRAHAGALPPLDETEPDGAWSEPGSLSETTMDTLAGNAACQPGTFAGNAACQPGTFAPSVTFYPPVMDDAADSAPAYAPAEGAAAEGTAEDWPYAAFPQSDARFVSGGHTYPEHVEPDEPYEYADEDEAPRSLYVEPDEAEKAKRVLWDRYLKGGRR